MAYHRCPLSVTHLRLERAHLFPRRTGMSRVYPKPCSAGPCCTVVPEDEVAERQLEVVHAQCLAENRALMLITPLQCELLLAPVKTDPSAPTRGGRRRGPCRGTTDSNAKPYQ